MNRAKRRVLLARMDPIQAFSLLPPRKKNTRLLHGILSGFSYNWIKLTSSQETSESNLHSYLVCDNFLIIVYDIGDCQVVSRPDLAFERLINHRFAMTLLAAWSKRSICL